MSGDSDGATGRSTCAYCDMSPEYVLSVSDPAPPDMAVIEGSVGMPICTHHFDKLEQSLQADIQQSGGDSE